MSALQSQQIPAGLRPSIEAKLHELAVNGNRSSAELPIRCPHPDHEDEHPSASWNWKKAAWKCHACGASGGWKRFCQLTGIPLSSNGSGQLVRRARRLEHYDYTAADGRIRRKIRTVPKGFRWCVVGDDGKELAPRAAGVSGNPCRLYRLDAVHEAIKHGVPVFVVEGEKAVDRLSRLGLVATCNPEGAAEGGQKPKWREDYSRELAGGDLVICGDLDGPGQAHAAEIARQSVRHAARVRVLDLAELARSTGFDDLREKSGLDDWIERRRQAGAETVADELTKWIDSLEDYGPPSDPAPRVDERQEESGPVVVCMADIEPEEIRWLWYPRIARGKVTLLEGDPGVGKSYVTVAIAAALSSGGGLPDRKSFEASRVLMLTSEDGLGDTLRPRLDSLGADVSKVFACDVPIDFSTTDGLDFARRKIEEYRPAVVIIDPIVAYVGSGTDTHRANHVRSILAPLASIAGRFGAAILAVRHLSKGSAARSIYRGQGSIDFTAAARSVLLAGFDPTDQERRALVQIKTNIGPIAPTLGFEIPDGRFRWTGDSTLTASDLLSAESSGEEKSAEEEAREFLLEILGDSRVRSTDVKKEAGEAGIAERTLWNAKRKLGIQAERDGFGPGAAWYWKLPEAS